MSYTNSAEGQADNTTATTGNTGAGSGTAASTVTIDTGGTIKFITAAAKYGNRGYRFGHPASGTGANRMMFPNGSAVAGRYAHYCAFRTNAVADGQVEDVMHLRHSGGNVGFLNIAADGRLQMYDAGGVAISVSNGGTSKSTNPLLADHWYGVCMTRTKGTGSGDGQLGYAYYDLDAGGVEVQSWNATNVNAGTADTTHGCYGRSTARTNAHTVDYDDLRGDALGSGYMTPAVADLAVVQYDPGTFVATGGVEPYGISQDTGTAVDAVVVDDGSVSGQGVFVVPQDPDDPSTWTITDDIASTVTDLTVLPVPASASGLVRYDGSWA